MAIIDERTESKTPLFDQATLQTCHYALFENNGDGFINYVAVPVDRRAAPIRAVSTCKAGCGHDVTFTVTGFLPKYPPPSITRVDIPSEKVRSYVRKAVAKEFERAIAELLTYAPDNKCEACRAAAGEPVNDHQRPEWMPRAEWIDL